MSASVRTLLARVRQRERARALRSLLRLDDAWARRMRVLMDGIDDALRGIGERPVKSVRAKPKRHARNLGVQRRKPHAAKRAKR